MDQIICLKLYNVEVTAPLTSSTTFVISERAQCKAHPCSLANLEDAPRELPARATTHAGSRSLRPGRAKTQKKARASAGQGVRLPELGARGEKSVSDVSPQKLRDVHERGGGAVRLARRREADLALRRVVDGGELAQEGLAQDQDLHAGCTVYSTRTLYRWGAYYTRTLYIWGAYYTRTLYVWGAYSARTLYVWGAYYTRALYKFISRNDQKTRRNPKF